MTIVGKRSSDGFLTELFFFQSSTEDPLQDMINPKIRVK